MKQYSGNPEICRMESTGYGGAPRYVDIPHGDVYTQVTDVVNVTNGTLNLAFYEQSGAGANLQIDDVTVLPCGNIQNFGFETGDLTGWIATGNSAGVDGSDPYQGQYKCYFWNSGAFTQKLEQTVTGLTNGIHTVTAWVKQDSGSPSVCQMELSGHGGSTVYSVIPHGSDYIQVSGMAYVTNGQLKVTFHEEGSGCNLQIDSVIVH